MNRTDESSWTERERKTVRMIRASGADVRCRFANGRRTFEIVEGKGGERPTIRTVAAGAVQMGPG